MGVHGVVVEEQICVCSFVLPPMPNTRCLLLCKRYYTHMVNFIQPELAGLRFLST